MFFSAPIHSTLDTRPFSLDQPTRPGEHLRRNRQADLLGRLEIDDKLELLRLLHRSGLLGTFHVFVYENSRAHGVSLHGQISPVILWV